MTFPHPCRLRNLPHAWIGRSRGSLLCATLGVLLVVGLFGCGRRPAPEQICLRFANLKNAKSPQAEALLGPAPAWPMEPITSAEADRLDAEFMLRGSYRVKEVRTELIRGTSNPPARARYVLVIEGKYDSEPVQVLAGTRSERRQRLVVNPDVIVEVREGKLYGVGLRLHEGP